MLIKESLGLVSAVFIMSVGFSLSALAGAPAAPPEVAEDHAPEHQMADLGRFTFEDGSVLENLQISYVTHGELAPEADNVILALHPFLLEHHGQDFMIGPGKALDTDKYFIIAPDSLGNSWRRNDISTGPTGSGLKMDFPRYTFSDLIKTELMLVRDYLEFDQVLAIVGGSSGGWKAYQIAVTYPDFAEAIVPIGASPVLPAVAAFHTHRMQDAIELDPRWSGGNYFDVPLSGLRVALMNHFNWVFGEQWKRENLVTRADYVAFDVQWGSFVPYYDPRDVYFELSSVLTYDVGKSGEFDGDLNGALSSIKAKVFAVGISSDQLVPATDSLPWLDSISDASYVEIKTDFGHIACCGFDPEANVEINKVVSEFIAKIK